MVFKRKATLSFYSDVFYFYFFFKFEIFRQLFNYMFESYTL